MSNLFLFVIFFCYNIFILRCDFMENIIKNGIEFVKDYFKNDFSGHDYFHTLRVYNTARHIAVKEKGDLFIVSLAALLHDVDDIKLSMSTHKNKDNARRFMESNNLSNEIIEKVICIINDISYKGTDTKPSKILEGKIIQDADRLDAIGAIGIARAFAYGGSHNRVMHDPDQLPKLNISSEEYRNHVSTTINHFYEKLFNLKDLMNTNTAKEIAVSKETYMKDFIDRFLKEWDGIS